MNDERRPEAAPEPTTTAASSRVADPYDIPQQLRRCREASYRLPPMEDCRRDPVDPDTRFRCVECKRDVRLKPYVRLTAQSVLCKPCFKASGGVPR